MEIHAIFHLIDSIDAPLIPLVLSEMLFNANAKDLPEIKVARNKVLLFCFVLTVLMTEGTQDIDEQKQKVILC